MTEYIRTIELDDKHIIKRDEVVEAEKRTALADLLAENSFNPKCIECGPYDVSIGIRDNNMVMHIGADILGKERKEVLLSISPFRRIIKDYFIMCESYYSAVGVASPCKLEAIDMGRRGVHNEGSELLQTVLSEKITLDFDTARRLFTLICVLHIK